MNVILYTQDNGTVAIIRPTEEALSTMTIEQIAAKDVPAGMLFEIVDAATIPADRTFRNAWEHSNSTIRMFPCVAESTVGWNCRVIHYFK